MASTACTAARFPRRPASRLRAPGSRCSWQAVTATATRSAATISCACQRNVDLTYIVMDNHVYGMTKGQPSPTTEPDWRSKLAPGGTGVREFHPLVIALASGRELRRARVLG